MCSGTGKRSFRAGACGKGTRVERVGELSTRAEPRSEGICVQDSSGFPGPQPHTQLQGPEGAGILDTTAGRWWVLHTRSRHEKVVASALEEQRIGHYLPLVQVQRTYGRRRLTVQIPLFPGYVFLCGGLNECDAAWQTNRVARIIYVDNQEQIRTELQHIYRVVESGEPVDLYPSLRQGRRCRVRSGPLRGVEGVVVRRRNPCRMYISATMLGQSAVIEIDAAVLEAVD